MKSLFVFFNAAYPVEVGDIYKVVYTYRIEKILDENDIETRVNMRCVETGEIISSFSISELNYQYVRKP